MCPASLTTFWYFGYSAASHSVTLVFSPTTFRNSIGNFVNGLAGTSHFYSDRVGAMRKSYQNAYFESSKLKSCNNLQCNCYNLVKHNLAINSIQLTCVSCFSRYVPSSISKFKASSLRLEIPTDSEISFILSAVNCPSTSVLSSSSSILNQGITNCKHSTFTAYFPPFAIRASFWPADELLSWVGSWYMIPIQSLLSKVSIISHPTVFCFHITLRWYFKLEMFIKVQVSSI